MVHKVMINSPNCPQDWLTLFDWSRATIGAVMHKILQAVHKMIDGRARGELKDFKPTLTEPLRLCKKRTRNSLEGIQVVRKVNSKSLDVYKRGFFGVLSKMWSKIPLDIIRRGERTSLSATEPTQAPDGYKTYKANSRNGHEYRQTWKHLKCVSSWMKKTAEWRKQLTHTMVNLLDNNCVKTAKMVVAFLNGRIYSIKCTSNDDDDDRVYVGWWCPSAAKLKLAKWACTPHGRGP